MKRSLALLASGRAKALIRRLAYYPLLTKAAAHRRYLQGREAKPHAAASSNEKRMLFSLGRGRRALTTLYSAREVV